MGFLVSFQREMSERKEEEEKRRRRREKKKNIYVKGIGRKQRRRRAWRERKKERERIHRRIIRLWCICSAVGSCSTHTYFNGKSSRKHTGMWFSRWTNTGDSLGRYWQRIDCEAVGCSESRPMCSTPWSPHAQPRSPPRQEHL